MQVTTGAGGQETETIVLEDEKKSEDSDGSYVPTPSPISLTEEQGVSDKEDEGETSEDDEARTARWQEDVEMVEQGLAVVESWVKRAKRMLAYAVS